MTQTPTHAADISPASLAVVLPRAEPRVRRYRAETVEEQPFANGSQFDFFQAVRLLHALRDDSAPTPHRGTASCIVRFRTHAASSAFPASAILDIARTTDPEAPAEVTVNFMGLTGPSGILPRHYTDLMHRVEREARGEQRNVLRDWFDLFNHRLISLFFRAWEKYRYFLRRNPNASNDRAAEATFPMALRSLFGLGMRLPARTRATERGAREERHAQLDDVRLLYYSGLLSQRPRSAVNLQALVSDFFGVPVVVEQFVGSWLTLDPPAQTRLGIKQGNCRLGIDAVVGDRTWNRQNKLRVKIGPLGASRFKQFVPDHGDHGGASEIFLAARLIRLYLGPDLEFDIQLLVDGRDVPVRELAAQSAEGMRLGWTSWLGDVQGRGTLGDTVFAEDTLQTT